MTHNSNDGAPDALRDRVYLSVSEMLKNGRFIPGEKISMRRLAKEFEVSPTPVREVLYRLVSEGALESEANRSARVPILSPQNIQELKIIRVNVETLAALYAVRNSSSELVDRLVIISTELNNARLSGDISNDMSLIYRFQSELYRGCGMPTLVSIIDSLWMKTGPYLNMLYPRYIENSGSDRKEWRIRLIQGLRDRDEIVVAHEIERGVTKTLDYITDVMEAASLIKTVKW